MDPTAADETAHPPTTTPQTRCPACAAQTVVVDPSGVYRWITNDETGGHVADWTALDIDSGG